MDLKGKNVVISGGICGIGLATCKQLINCKISCLAILDIIENLNVIQELKNLDSSIKILLIKTDVTDRQHVENAFKKIIQDFRTIDIVICNAAMSDENQMELTMNINFFGVVYMTLAAIDVMSKSKGNKGGIIMAMSSTTGIGATYFPAPVTTASKHAVVGFYRTLSNEFYFNKHNIKFLLICPGQTKTGLLDHVGLNLFDSDVTDAFQSLIKSFPMQSADVMGKMIIEVLKNGENGSAWIADDGKLSQIKFKNYWP